MESYLWHKHNYDKFRNHTSLCLSFFKTPKYALAEKVFQYENNLSLRFSNKEL